MKRKTWDYLFCLRNTGMYYKQKPSCFKMRWTTALDFIWANFSFSWVFIILFSNTVVYPYQQYLFLNGSEYTHLIWTYPRPQLREEKIRKAIKHKNKILTSEWKSTAIYHKWKLENISMCGLGVLTAFKMHILPVSGSQSGIWGPWDYTSESLWSQNCPLSITWKTRDTVKISVGEMWRILYFFILNIKWDHIPQISSLGSGLYVQVRSPAACLTPNNRQFISLYPISRSTSM